MMVVDQVVKVVVVIVNTFDNLVDTMSFVYKIHYKNYLLLMMTMKVVVEVEMEE
jgi:hypothetical protein